jgi:hypothetical protein
LSNARAIGVNSKARPGEGASPAAWDVGVWSWSFELSGDARERRESVGK